MGKNLDQTDSPEINNPPTKDPETEINFREEQIKTHEDTTSTLEKELDTGVDPPNTLSEQSEGYFANALRKTKSCLLGLFGK